MSNRMETYTRENISSQLVRSTNFSVNSVQPTNITYANIASLNTPPLPPTRPYVPLLIKNRRDVYQECGRCYRTKYPININASVHLDWCLRCEMNILEDMMWSNIAWSRQHRKIYRELSNIYDKLFSKQKTLMGGIVYEKMHLSSVQIFELWIIVYRCNEKMSDKLPLRLINYILSFHPYLKLGFCPLF
jgi:hypothetical protein